MSLKEKTQGFDISDYSCALIGCGGLGCNAAVHLVGAGIGKLYICDFDTVSESNLNRQFLYSNDDIGKIKCYVMQEKLSAYSNDSEIIPIYKKISNITDLSFAKDCDIIICAVDNLDARNILESFSKENNKALVCGGIDGFYGMAYLYVPNKGPSPFEAGFSSSKRADHSISSSAGIIGSSQAALTIQYLISRNDNLSGKLLIYDGYKFETLTLK